jgi:hypothetical protein
MAQTRKRRRTKHRGNAVGMIEARGRTGRKPEASEHKLSARDEARVRREERMNRQPTWRAAINRAAISSVVLFVIAMLLLKQGAALALLLGVIAFVFYVPVGYYTDQFVYRRRLAKRKP